MNRRLTANPLLNKFAPDTGDEALVALEDAQIEAGEWPAKKSLPVRRYSSEDGSRLVLWYDRSAQHWVADVTDAQGTTTRLTSPSKAKILEALASANADVEIEHQADVEAANAGPLYEAEHGVEQAEWERNYHSGQVFLQEVVEYSSQDVIDHTKHMLEGKMNSLRLPWTSANMDLCFCLLWDAPGSKLAEIIDAARAEKQRLINEEAAQQEAAELAAHRLPVREAVSPSANSRGRVVQPTVTCDPDDKTMDIKALRHKALFGEGRKQ